VDLLSAQCGLGKTHPPRQNRTFSAHASDGCLCKSANPAHYHSVARLACLGTPSGSATYTTGGARARPTELGQTKFSFALRRRAVAACCIPVRRVRS
jgi:hypothetical protein